MISGWDNHIKNFLKQAQKHQVKMILVGGGAVYFHGYQRHSADIDFWIDTSKENLKRLIRLFKEMDYDIDKFPKEVEQQEQNISVKFSPSSLNLELITKFSSSKSFDDIYAIADLAEIMEEPVLRWRVISYEDLIDSKIKAGRPKDLLDIQELQRINKSDNHR